MLISTWWQSHKPYKTSGWELPLWKVYSAQRRNTSPNAKLLLRASHDFLPPRPLLDIGQKSCCAAQCSLCTDCFQGDSIAWNPLWKWSPFWRRLIWHKYAFFSQRCNSSIERARAISSWWQFHKLHKTRVWELPPCDVYPTQRMNTSPNVQLGQKLNPWFFPT